MAILGKDIFLDMTSIEPVTEIFFLFISNINIKFAKIRNLLDLTYH